MRKGGSKEHMDYMRSRRAYKRTDPLERLLAQTVFAPGGCRLYTGAATKNGYPVASEGHNTVLYGHRLVYERLVGPIQRGSQVHHKCENIRCLAVAHLVCVTVREHRNEHGLGVGPCRKCGHDDFYVRQDTGTRMCRECRRRRRANGAS